MIINIVANQLNGGRLKMILFEQYPLNGLDTLEDEILFLLANKVDLIAGMNKNSSITENKITGCCIQYCAANPDHVNVGKIMTRLCKIIKKYNKSFKGLFEFGLHMDINGKYKLNIQENMADISTETKKILGN